jgi:hypothetical protein
VASARWIDDGDGVGARGQLARGADELLAGGAELGDRAARLVDRDRADPGSTR